MNKIAAGERFGTHAFLVAYCDWARRRHQAITQDVKNLTSWFSTWLERGKQSVWILVTQDLTAQWQVSVKIVLIISLKFTTIQNNSYKILKHVLHSRHELVYLNTSYPYKLTFPRPLSFCNSVICGHVWRWTCGVLWRCTPAQNELTIKQIEICSASLSCPKMMNYSSEKLSQFPSFVSTSIRSCSSGR